MSARFQSATAAREFALGGNAVLTLQSEKTGARFTYKIRAAQDGGLSFVSVLTGQDNEGDYTYLGIIRGGTFTRTGKSRIGADAPSALAMAWAWEALQAGHMPLAPWRWPGLGKPFKRATCPGRSPSIMRAVAGAATAP